jgi:hypothetical protein
MPARAAKALQRRLAPGAAALSTTGVPRGSDRSRGSRLRLCQRVVTFTCTAPGGATALQFSAHLCEPPAIS